MDNTDLVTFNNREESAIEVVARVQLVLDTWHQALTFTKDNLKLNKYFWTIQDFMWKNRKCTCKSKLSFNSPFNKKEKESSN